MENAPDEKGEAPGRTAANPEPLILAELKEAARQIFEETLARIDIRATLGRKLMLRGSVIHCGDAAIDLKAYRERFAIAIGKAAFAMAEGLTQVLGSEFPLDGILVSPSSGPRTLPGWEEIVAGHPVPTGESFRAGRAILEKLRCSGEETLVFFLLSGGGSALVERSLDEGISLEDFQQLHHALVACGAPIEAINAVRKHLSATKGGRLATAAPLAMKVTFGVSDVPEGFESALASGPTLPDPTTIQDAERVAREFHLLEKLPDSIRRKFEKHVLAETPKAGDPAFSRAHFVLLLGRRDLFHHAHCVAESRGFVVACDNLIDGWPLELAANYLLSQLAMLERSAAGRSIAIISDGEVSSPVMGDGIGGRNSAFVLACVEKIAGKPIAVLSAGTDGIDGNSPAAGAVADGETLARVRSANLDVAQFFRRSDAYSFFARLDDAIVTGPTGNNLRDLRIILSG